jgi:hypothetical protein
MIGEPGYRVGVVSRAEVLDLLGQGCDYPEIGRRLGVPAGQAYLVGTGMPADGGDTYTAAERQRPGVLPSAQHLVGPPVENPTAKDVIRCWMRERTARDEAMQQAEARHDPSPPEPQDPDDQHDAITVLGRDHNQVNVLQKQLAALPGHRRGGSPAQMDTRKLIVDMITERVSRHVAAEGQHLWPAVRRVLPDGDGLADGMRVKDEQGRQTLDALRRLGPDTDEFDELVERLIAQLRQHVAYQAPVFLRLKQAVSGADLTALGERLRAAKARAAQETSTDGPRETSDRQSERAEG